MSGVRDDLTEDVVSYDALVAAWGIIGINTAVDSPAGVAEQIADFRERDWDAILKGPATPDISEERRARIDEIVNKRTLQLVLPELEAEVPAHLAKINAKLAESGSKKEVTREDLLRYAASKKSSGFVQRCEDLLTAEAQRQ